MKFSINAKTFASALGQQLRVINAKNALAILDNFKLSSKDDRKLEITASDPETTSILEIEVIPESGGELCINAAKLTDIVRKLGDKPMTFEATDTEATITCGKGVYTMPVISANEYPLREVTTEGYFAMPMATILDGFNATRGAVATDIVRPVMCGVYMNVLETGGIDFVATDTHQLVVCHTECEGLQPQGIIISSKTVSLVLNMFAKYPEVQIAINGRNITFHAEDITLMSVLIQGQYPNYMRVLPGEAPYKIKVNRKELLDVINRVSGFASNSTSLLVLEDGGMMDLKVSAKDMNFGQKAEDYIMADGMMNGIRIGMSSEYLTKMLSIFSEEEVALQITDPARPLMIEEGGIKAIIMPMTVTE